jgi:hypothetical protein
MALDDLPLLDISEGMLTDVTALVETADLLEKLVSASAEVGQQVGISAVAKAVAFKLEISTAKAREPLAALLNLHFALKGWKRTPEVGVKRISQSLRASSDTEHKALGKQWEQSSPKIIAALTRLTPDHPLAVASKAYLVAMSRQYELVEMRIFTDLRPVFNDAGDAILQSVITHVLSLDYHEGPTHRVIQFNLDANDVKDLKEMCARAERKGAVVKRELEKQPWPTTVFREPTETE